MRISELSRLTQVSTRSIRHYEQKGLLQAARTENSYRLFDDAAVQRVQAIQLYLKLGLTADEIAILFQGETVGPDEYEYCYEMAAMYEEKLTKVNSQIQSLLDLKALLEKQIQLTLAKQ